MTTTAEMPANTYQFTVTAEGHNCAQGGSVASATANLVVSAQSTSTSVVASPPATVFGQPVNFSATVTPSIATGSIQFQIDGGMFGPSVTLSNGSATSGSISTLSASSHTISAVYTPSGGFMSSTGATSLAVSKADQTITFGALPGRVFGDPDFTVSATATSGLAVGFTASGACTVNASASVHISGAGSCAVTAHQGGDKNYNAAPDVPQTFTITKATPVITWGTPADIVYGTALSDAQLNATANVAGTFAYTPAAGTVLEAGNGQRLSVILTPIDTANYFSGGKTVYINVLKPGPDPTFVWVPDVHLAATSTTPRWPNQVNWIINNRATWNIQAAFMSGDTQTPAMAWSQGTAPNQYGWFQVDALNPALPWLSAIGNHDYLNSDYPYWRRDSAIFGLNMGEGRLASKPYYISQWQTIESATVLMSAATAQDPTISVMSVSGMVEGQYIQIDSEKLKVTAVNGTILSVTRGVKGTTAAEHNYYSNVYFVDGLDNQAIELTVGMRTFLVVALELFPRPGALTWATSVINNHPKSEVIIITHALLKVDGTPIARTDTWGPNAYGLPQTDASGVDLEEWFKQFPNLRAAFCGHYITTPYQAHRTVTAADGHLFTEIFANYQSKPTTPSDSILLISLGATMATVRTMNTDTGNEETTYTPYSISWAPVN